ncbi:MAG: tyrosine-type recombinase/integrase [Promethearchaeota archaeon]
MSEETINNQSNKKKEVFPTNEEVIKNYLKKYNSKNSINSSETAFKFFFNENVEHGLKHWIHKGFGWKKSIFKIKKRDVNNYHIFLNKHPDLSIGTKKDYFNIFKRLIVYILTQYDDYFEDKFEVFYFYMWIKETDFKFSEHGHKRPISNKNVTLEFEEIEHILSILKIRNFVHYLVVRTIVETGMRPGELLSIQLERVDEEGINIPLENDLRRRFVSGIGKRGEKAYFITKELSILLLDYLNNTRKTILTNTNQFFITQSKTPMKWDSLSRYVINSSKLVGIKRNISPTTFRKTINTKRKLMGCPTEDRRILLNHKVRDVNFNHYVKMKYKEFLKLYDNWFPYKLLNL